MSDLVRTRVAAVLVAALVVAVAVAGVSWWLGRPDSDLAAAAERAPADAERLTWTDWSGIRAELGVELDADSPGDQVQAFLDEGFERDLTSTSALVQSTPALQREFGFSPATLDWELFSQSSEGAVVMMGLGHDTDTDALAETLERLGYERPEDDTGVWRAGGDVLARIDPTLTPELQYLVVDADAGLLFGSDRADYLAQAAAGDDAGPESVSDVVGASGDPLSAAVYTGTNACSALAMGNASADDRAEAERLVAEAGEVNPVTGFAISAQPDGGVRVALSFENEDQARTNADTRALLARGPAPGQGGTFADRFAVDSVTAEGNVVTLKLDPVDGEYVLSDLSSGPVLFATC